MSEQPNDKHPLIDELDKLIEETRAAPMVLKAARAEATVLWVRGILKSMIEEDERQQESIEAIHTALMLLHNKQAESDRKIDCLGMEAGLDFEDVTEVDLTNAA